MTKDEVAARLAVTLALPENSDPAVYWCRGVRFTQTKSGRHGAYLRTWTGTTPAGYVVECIDCRGGYQGRGWTVEGMLPTYPYDSFVIRGEGATMQEALEMAAWPPYGNSHGCWWEPIEETLDYPAISACRKGTCAHTRSTHGLLEGEKERVLSDEEKVDLALQRAVERAHNERVQAQAAYDSMSADLWKTDQEFLQLNLAMAEASNRFRDAANDPVRADAFALWKRRSWGREHASLTLADHPLLAPLEALSAAWHAADGALCKRQRELRELLAASPEQARCTAATARLEGLQNEQQAIRAQRAEALERKARTEWQAAWDASCAAARRR